MVFVGMVGAGKNFLLEVLKLTIEELDVDIRYYIRYQLKSLKKTLINEFRNTRRRYRRIEPQGLLLRSRAKNQQAEIEDKKEARINAGMEESEAIQLAERRKNEAIKNFNNEVIQNLDSIWNTELQNRLNQIEQEKQAWIQKGVDEVKATQWAEQAKADAQKNAAMNVLKSQYEEYKAYKYGGYKGLQEYQYNQLVNAGIDPKDLYMTPTQLQEFQQAQKASQNSLLPNFMTEQDKIANAWQWRGYAQRELANYIGSAEGYERMKSYVENFNPYDKNLYNRLADPRWATEKEESPIYYQSDKNLIGNIMPFNETQSMMAQMLNQSAELDAISQQPMDNAMIVNLSTSLSDLTTAISNIKLPQAEQNYSDRNNQQPSNVNVTVQIQEAHAWDTAHIQELADKVADEIEPAITSAIGGNSNSY